MKPKFSIIIPLYNKAPYIRKALESVHTQTFTDWECIIINDGSILDCSLCFRRGRPLPSGDGAA